MDYDLDDFLDEYDDFSRRVVTADHNTFHTRLNQFFQLLDNGDESIAKHVRWLEGRIGTTAKTEDVFGGSGNNAGSGTINLPAGKYDRLAIYLHFFRSIKDGTLDLLTVIHRHFYAGKSINDALAKMQDALLEPFIDEFRRYIDKNFDEDVPDDDGAVSASIPASDRNRAHQAQSARIPRDQQPTRNH